MEKEALTLEAYAIAAAAKNSGGFVIVQVERIAEKGTLPARQVKIPASWSTAWWWRDRKIMPRPFRNTITPPSAPR
jgi:hypothetical protein